MLLKWWINNQNDKAMETDEFWTEKWIKFMKHVNIISSIIYLGIYLIYLYIFIYDTFNVLMANLVTRELINMEKEEIGWKKAPKRFGLSLRLF